MILYIREGRGKGSDHCPQKREKPANLRTPGRFGFRLFQVKHDMQSPRGKVKKRKEMKR